MENQTLKQLQNRKSIRHFTGEAVSKEDLETIFKTAQRAPTSINGQQISLIYTRDKEKLKTIAELCGGQTHIATADVFVGVVIDFNRTDIIVESIGKKQIIEQSAEGIMVGAVDAGIMLHALQVAAEALGYGTTAIGGVRKDSDAIIEIFNLPKKTFLAVGCTIGVPTQEAKNAPLKPRISLESFVMQETYDREKVRNGVLGYEQILKTFRDTTGSGSMPTYAKITSSNYADVYYRKTAKSLVAQGFAFKDE
ncbi:nitroreductase family protein [Sulfurospirillum barnesii]|uniref:Nitroreductase n=1 Tax=Sulfurospirillum barnesii (strain ATCC 700032 / DSM 10660 / SES-3) TaxID=760154 RepID=I3XX11_SULBS|nr:nitroreductase family protein [Sulfurospirillum barnesii]AFL68485.1 nitroreductase [Sulfurospirillum barnesii SES-3]